ncbi:unnamed protein product [Miscanthus lutarioriparius]|uniref:RING-type domain-containing protein n=1 Tax=Miscanthus lutarioriparius TaxID=422564 RepID=A0A811NQA1_9POAL|nr:unnamed protein product [Miscanthus lutarioriparius]
MAAAAAPSSSEGPVAVRTCVSLGEVAAAPGGGDRAAAEDCGVCAICLDRIALQETALVKGCDHAYCVTCILRWASYKQNPLCPQCKHPFEFLSVHRSLDGCLHDYLFEESVCLLLRAAWFEPLIVEAHEEALEEEFFHQQYQYDDAEDDLDEESYYMSRSPSIRIGNRRWGDNGYIRGGRKEARPVNTDASAGPSKDVAGRRAKRAQKREAADRAAAEKHLKHLQRLGLRKAPEPEVPAEVGPQVNE